MTEITQAFQQAYAEALRRHLATRSEQTLTVGHDLGRRALVEGISILDIVEFHYGAVDDADGVGSDVRQDALQFLLQTLTALDVATRGFLDGTRRYVLQRAAYDQARTTSLTLQRAMLGVTELPPQFAVRYEPAVPPLEIGGDWYDVVPLPDDRTGIIVGDCVGRGLSAAAVMGQLRSSARALLSTGVGPARMLDHLDVVAANIPGAQCTTVLAAVVEPDGGVLRYSSAGHMPALLAAPGFDPRFPGPDGNGAADVAGVHWLDQARSVPLATFDLGMRPEVQMRLEPGSTLVMFTDGLVERRRAAIDDGIGQVADLLAYAARRTPDDVAESVLAALRPADGYDDDVAMVVYRHPPAPLRLRVPAHPDELNGLRNELWLWLAEAGVDAQLATDTVMAANEACTNSIEHGYRDDHGGAVTVVAAIERRELTVTVSDSGTWKPVRPTRQPRGRGLQMMRAMVDTVSIDHTDDGTVVELRADLRKPQVAS